MQTKTNRTQVMKGFDQGLDEGEAEEHRGEDLVRGARVARDTGRRVTSREALADSAAECGQADGEPGTEPVAPARAAARFLGRERRERGRTCGEAAG